MTNKINDDLYNLGAAEIDITPKPGVDLYTLDNNPRNSNQIHSNLYASAILINQLKDSLIIISLDLIWVDKDFSLSIQDWIRSKYDSIEIEVLLIASHSHSTPQISQKIQNSARPNSEYLSFLFNQICTLVENAWENIEQCYAMLSIANSQLSVNRRKKIIDTSSLKRGIIKKIIANRPNYNGACDDYLYCVWFYNNDRKEKAVLLNYASHASLYRGNAVSSDYPGEVSNYLKNEVSKDLIVCFLQGFTGNIKADLTINSFTNFHSMTSFIFNSFFDRVQFNKKITNTEIEVFSKKIGKIALERKKETLIKPYIFFINKTVKLPYKDLNEKNYANLDLYYVSISDKLKIFLVGGEIFTEYSIWIRDLLKKQNLNTLTVGYCNDMVGYVPTKEAINSGGYEVDRTSEEFALQGPFSDKIESILKNEIREIVNSCPRK